MPRVYIGIGSNIDREASIRAGVQALCDKYGELQLSTVYESDAVGFEGDPFYNLVAGFETSDSIEQVLAYMTEIETRQGRRRGDARFAARTLDMDLLLYDDLIVSGEGYHVPRDEISRYAFVLCPLAELLPDMPHPETGASFGEMWSKFDKARQPVSVVTFAW